jgi:hypothetical protein
MKKEYKIYRIAISYFQENKEDFPRSNGGSTSYLVSSENISDAKYIALKQFKIDHEAHKSYDKINVSGRAIDVKIIKAISEGIIYL